MSKPILIFDIETGPLPENQILIPAFEPPGNIKDPAKLAEREREHRRKAIEQAALDPLTGKVVAIGAKCLGLAKTAEFILGDEADILTKFWRILESWEYPILAGFNSHTFDLPFLFRRSWAHGIPAPVMVYRSGKYWNSDRTIDLREVWQLGDRMAKGSLDSIAQACGLGQKNGDGADFATLLEIDQAKAIEYLANDLKLTENLYNRIVGAF